MRWVFSIRRQWLDSEGPEEYWPMTILPMKSLLLFMLWPNTREPEGRGRRGRRSEEGEKWDREAGRRQRSLVYTCLNSRHGLLAFRTSSVSVNGVNAPSPSSHPPANPFTPGAPGGRLFLTMPALFPPPGLRTGCSFCQIAASPTICNFKLTAMALPRWVHSTTGG